MFKSKLLVVVPILFFSCKSSGEFTGFSYDPPGVTNTTDKIISTQKKRIIGAGNPKIWVSNEFEGARLSDFCQIDEQTFEVLIEPENFPINNSPWFAFNIWADELTAINLRLVYKKGKHRYKPKVYSQEGSLSSSHIIKNATYDSSDGSTTFPIYVKETTQQISAQLLKETQYSDLVSSTKKTAPTFVTIDTVGYSHQQRAILEFTIDERLPNDNSATLVLLSRQHPPEVTGYSTYQAFWKELISDSELAIEFRKYFMIKGYPMINPDGVYNGHWRHNAAGIDLNRDWKEFNQPETRAVRDALLPLIQDEFTTVFYGIDFHSTNENILYPINQEVVTKPDNFTQKWAVSIKEDNPTLNFSSEEFDTSSPISKNWLFHTFGADAVTFEVDDVLNTKEITKLGTNAARSLMQHLLEEWESR